MSLVLRCVGTRIAYAALEAGHRLGSCPRPGGRCGVGLFRLRCCRRRPILARGWPSGCAWQAAVACFVDGGQATRAARVPSSAGELQLCLAATAGRPSRPCREFRRNCRSGEPVRLERIEDRQPLFLRPADGRRGSSLAPVGAPMPLPTLDIAAVGRPANPIAGRRTAIPPSAGIRVAGRSHRAERVPPKADPPPFPAAPTAPGGTCKKTACASATTACTSMVPADRWCRRCDGAAVPSVAVRPRLGATKALKPPFAPVPPLPFPPPPFAASQARERDAMAAHAILDGAAGPSFPP